MLQSGEYCINIIAQKVPGTFYSTEVIVFWSLIYFFGSLMKYIVKFWIIQTQKFLSHNFVLKLLFTKKNWDFSYGLMSVTCLC